MRKRARNLRRHQTDAEQKLWWSLRNRQLSNHEFRRQHPVGPYIADFCCLEQNLIIEVDGGQHLTQIERDERRTKYLNQNGYQVLGFWNHQVLNELPFVLEAIRLVLENHPHPNPLPKRERENLQVG